MTPKEKAKELVGKYTTVLSLSFSKEFAEIAVDEIINSTSWQYITNGLDYWNEVKHEISQL